MSVERYVDQWLASASDTERCDLMELAYHLPLMVICDLLGVPMEDRELIRGWADARSAGTGSEDSALVLEAEAASTALEEYVTDLADAMRASAHGSDLVTVFLGAEREGRVSHSELIANFVMFLFAGYETTTILIGAGMLALLRDPTTWRQVCDRPDLSLNATEELLRFVSPVQFLQRVPTSDIELAGVRLPKGKTVGLMLAAANRDPAVFAAGDQLDVTRSNAREHLSLGFGPHFCLGAALARLEVSTLLRTLGGRYPDTKVVTSDVELTGSAPLRRPKALYVTLGEGSFRDRAAAATSRSSGPAAATGRAQGAA
jgi:cytochrome P450